MPFKITWTGKEYRVSIPNYDGGTVYTKEEVDDAVNKAKVETYGFVLQDLLGRMVGLKKGEQT